MKIRIMQECGQTWWRKSTWWRTYPNSKVRPHGRKLVRKTITKAQDMGGGWFQTIESYETTVGVAFGPIMFYWDY